MIIPHHANFGQPSLYFQKMISGDQPIFLSLTNKHIIFLPMLMYIDNSTTPRVCWEEGEGKGLLSN